MQDQWESICLFATLETWRKETLTVPQAILIIIWQFVNMIGSLCFVYPNIQCRYLLQCFSRDKSINTVQS